MHGFFGGGLGRERERERKEKQVKEKRGEEQGEMTGDERDKTSWLGGLDGSASWPRL